VCSEEEVYYGYELINNSVVSRLLICVEIHKRGFALTSYGWCKGDVNALGWWDLFVNFGIAECFAFLVYTKWSNPVIHRNSRTQEASSSSSAIRYLDWNSGLVIASEDQSQDRMCGLQDIGGHIMKVPIIGFQVLLCMRLEEDEFCLELSKLHNYDDVVERVARHLGLDDPSKIRLTSHNCHSQQPKP
ncbi:Ubiquitin carboxyl-terminal hydrolase 13, partial [Camellia lanceoleosa]